MDQRGHIINDVDAEELVERLKVVTDVDNPRPEVRRKMPRRLRHFESAVRVGFMDDPDGEGTVLQLTCKDQPGLLSRVAAAIHEQGVQVHNARIATFGEKVEDTFLVSNADHQPLDDEARAALEENIENYLE
jgi:[protein-PII] uridylyltransferase